MPERGVVKLNIQRGAGIAEFASFLVDLENAYLALRLLPTIDSARHFTRRWHFLVDYQGVDPSTLRYRHWPEISGREIYPKDQLEITRINIQSPGWIELLGSLNPLQQIREYLKDRHDRTKDRAWRGETEKERALLENDILRNQAEHERINVISAFSELLEHVGFSSEERQRAVWERLGPPMMRLANHQDTGLLGSQNDEIDSKRK